MVFGDKFDMHEVTVLAGLTLWSVLWGIPGAVLSVPIMVVILIILKTMKHPVAAFLVGVMRGKFGSAGEDESSVKENTANSDGNTYAGSRTSLGSALTPSPGDDSPGEDSPGEDSPTDPGRSSPPVSSPPPLPRMHIKDQNARPVDDDMTDSGDLVPASAAGGAGPAMP